MAAREKVGFAWAEGSEESAIFIQERRPRAAGGELKAMSADGVRHRTRGDSIFTYQRLLGGGKAPNRRPCFTLDTPRKQVRGLSQDSNRVIGW